MDAPGQVLTGRSSSGADARSQPQEMQVAA